MAGTLSAKSKTIIVGDLILKVFLLIFCCSFFFAHCEVHAHGLSLFSKGEGLYASYSDHSPAGNAEVILADENGVIILEDKTDGKGVWKLPEVMEVIPYVIIVEAPGGHRAKITWEEFLEQRPKRLFDLLSIRVFIGVVFILGSGYGIQRLLLRKKA